MARPTLRTELCDRLGIEYPVVSAGMGPVAGVGDAVATADLVAAVSDAGGLGVIGGVSYAPDRLREEIRKVRALTDKPFGVDLLLAPNFLVPRGPSGSRGGGAKKASTRPAMPKIPDHYVETLRKIAADLQIEYKKAPPLALPGARFDLPVGQSYAGAQIEVVIEEEVPVFASGLGNPEPFAETLKSHGIAILSLVGNVRAARQVAAGGADFVVAQGTEAGGHTGRIGTLALVPQVIDAVAPRPVIAAGGISSGRALAGAIAMGAVGGWCGSVFLVSDEANQPDLQKQRILDASAEDTMVTRLYSGKTMRNITNPLIEAWEASGLHALPMGLQGFLIRDLQYSIEQAGRHELLMNAAGQTAGMLKKKRPAKEILEDLVAEAAEILASGLAKRVTASV